MHYPLVFEGVKLFTYNNVLQVVSTAPESKRKFAARNNDEGLCELKQPGTSISHKIAMYHKVNSANIFLQ